MAFKLELTRLGRSLYDAPNWMHPVPSWLASFLPYGWLVKSFERVNESEPAPEGREADERGG